MDGVWLRFVVRTYVLLSIFFCLPLHAESSLALGPPDSSILLEWRNEPTLDEWVVLQELIDEQGYYRSTWGLSESTLTPWKISVVVSPPLSQPEEQLQKVAERLSKKRGKRAWVREITRTDNRIVLEESNGKLTSLHHLLCSRSRFLRLTATRDGNASFSERDRYRFGSLFERTAIYYPRRQVE